MNRILAIAVAALAALSLMGCESDDDATSALSSPAAAANSGRSLRLDPSYGSSGIAAVPLNAATHDRFMAVTQGADGRTYAAGFIIVGEGDQAMAVARIDDNGKLDPTFGTSGVASVNVAVNGRGGEVARSVAVQSDGKVVIAGQVEADVTAGADARDSDVAVVRFDASGKPDASFGTNGFVKLSLGTGRTTSGTTFVGDTLWGMGLGSGNRIILFGSRLNTDASRTDTDFVITALTAAGGRDASFGTNGETVVDVSNVSDNPRHVLVQADGKIVTSGYSSINGVIQPVVIRTDANGKPDSNFGNNGVATARVLDGVTEAYSVSEQGNDYVLAGYGRGADPAEKVDLVVYRFNGSGQLDTSFGSNGVYRFDIAKEDDRGRNVIVLPDKRILAVGSGKKDAANIDALIALLDANGRPVSAFAENGHLLSDLGGPADAWFGVALSADKRYVLVAGYKGTDANSAGNDDAVIGKVLL